MQGLDRLWKPPPVSIALTNQPKPEKYRSPFISSDMDSSLEVFEAVEDADNGATAVAVFLSFSRFLWNEPTKFVLGKDVGCRYGRVGAESGCQWKKRGQ